ncbi:MAG TPA: hypothetical protein DCQ45_00655, partial [Erysipelotrichaceae bacterium]|nr:hypothetical protein [Erysipelotrichaceae bacterium]
DAKKEVREQAWGEGMAEGLKEGREVGLKEGLKEGRAEGRLEGAMLLKKVNHLLAKGMSDEEILTALPDVTVDFVKYARESYEEVLSLEAQQK